jgi:hypothetical protein
MRVWLGGSAALACAAMAVALYLSDLEKLSWIASAGSFVTGVSSLVLAYALTRSPASRPELPSSAPTESEPVPVVVYVTTTATRIGARAAGALLVRQPQSGMFDALSLVVASAGAGLV